MVSMGCIPSWGLQWLELSKIILQKKPETITKACYKMSKFKDEYKELPLDVAPPTPPPPIYECPETKNRTPNSLFRAEYLYIYKR